MFTHAYARAHTHTHTHTHTPLKHGVQACGVLSFYSLLFSRPKLSLPNIKPIFIAIPLEMYREATRLHGWKGPYYQQAYPYSWQTEVKPLLRIKSPEVESVWNHLSCGYSLSHSHTHGSVCRKCSCPPAALVWRYEQMLTFFNPCFPLWHSQCFAGEHGICLTPALSFSPSLEDLWKTWEQVKLPPTLTPRSTICLAPITG